MTVMFRVFAEARVRVRNRVREKEKGRIDGRRILIRKIVGRAVVHTCVIE
jgi:hypothetical protein